jgi:hypothetical protein
MSSSPIPATSDATPMSQLIQSAIQNMYQPWAAETTESNKLAYDNAIAAAKAGGPPAPTTYNVVTVDVAAVTAAFDNIAQGKPGDFSQVFISTPYAPPPAVPPPAVIPAGFPIGSQARGNIYLALDVAPLPVFPDGTPFSDARGNFTKRIIPEGVGTGSYWVKGS